MGRRINDHDWSATPLGPNESWPPSLRTAVDLMLNSRHPMWIGWGPEITFLYNDAYLSVLGDAKHPWALGRPAAEVWAEIWDVCGPLADKVFRHGEASFVDDVRLFMRRRDFTEETFYSFSYSPIRDEGGRIAGLFCPSTEVTAKVLNGRRLATLSELAGKALAERTTIGACTTAMGIIGANADDAPFALLYLLDGDRAQLQTAVGLDRGSMGAAPETVALDVPAAVSPWPLAAAVASGEPQLCAVPAEFAIAAAAGQRVRDAIVLPLAASGQDQPVGVLVAGVNPARPLDADHRTFFTLVASQLAIAICNAQSYETERRRADALAELDRAKTVFFSNVSHELRTPLTLVLSPLEDAVREAGGTAQQDRLLMAQRNAYRLQKLVNMLLDFSRIEAGKARVTFEPADVATLTAELAGTFRSTIERAGLQFTVDCPPLAQPVLIDRDMWEKIVLNLLSNAFKFTFEGGIAVALRQVDAAIELRVSDTGTGIAAEALPHLFERFHRIEGARARTHEGSGIGLALIQELVKLQGGTIDVDSTVNVGSCFTVRVPARAAQAAGERGSSAAGGGSRVAARAETFVEEAAGWLANAPARCPADDAAESDRRRIASEIARPRILLADDNADMRDYISRLLTDRYEVDCVADGLEAWRSLQESPPDLVLSDVMMPGLDGLELLRRARSDSRTREVPIILLSARAGEESRVEGLQGGADDYLFKPFSAKELQARVDSQINLVRLRREARAEAETLHEVSRTLGSELDLNLLVQGITDAGTRLTGAKFGAFFYNGVNEHGEAYTLYTLSGAPREAFEKLGQPRATPLFARTFHGEGIVRCDDATADPRYGQWGPHFGQPPGHLPVRSYLAAPVISRSGEVIGALLFGHPEPGVFDERCERIIQGVAGQAAVALDNARMYDAARRAAEERRQLLESERAARSEAERLSAAKDEFLATLSHELRNPLNAILGWSQVLARKEVQPDELKKGLDAVHRNARAQAQLIEDLLDMSRITSGKLRLDVQTVLPISFIEAAIDAVRPAAQAKGIRLETVIDPLAGPVSGDPNRLQQVVWNLLSNAIKFTSKGGKVQILLERVNSHVEISVADNGQGIDPGFLPQMFERFRQADPSITRRHGGLGLGLAIVKRLVELHGGTVHAASPGPGLGATFTVCLPLSILHRPVDDAERVHPRTSGRAVEIGQVDLAGVRVLVVDDDEDARELIARVLSESRAEVVIAGSAAEALSLLENQRPQVLVSDIGMPDMDGYELLRRVRARGTPPGDLRPIALTALARTEDRTRALLAGFLMHLSKPVEPSELVATVAAVVGRAGY
jgi:signal transduction histidine kinase/DNA-binding response OmpR family regulator